MMTTQAPHRRQFQLRGAWARFRESGRTQIHPVLTRPNWSIRFAIVMPLALLALYLRFAA